MNGGFAGSSLDFWVAAATLALLAGYVQGFTGFGFAVVFTPLLTFLIGAPHDVIFLSLLLGSALSLIVFVETYRSLRLARAWPLIVGSVVGTPAGIAVLSVLDAHALKVFIAASALVIATVWMIRLPPPLRLEPPAIGAAGLLGGFLNGSTSMGGPPPALMVSIQRWPVHEGRSALTTFNLISYLLGLATARASGMVQAGFLLRGLWVLPVAILGSLLGALSVRRVSRDVFGYALAVTVWLAGFFGLISTFAH